MATTPQSIRMMTLEQIRVANINLATAREAHDQATTLLGDILDTKKGFDQKAFTLFSGYMTAAIAVAGVAGTLYHDQHVSSLTLSFCIATVMLLVGVSCFVAALHDGTYGTLGSSPTAWLQAGVIDGADVALPRMLAAVTHHYEHRIQISIATNRDKARYIRYGIYAGLATPVVLFLALVLLQALL